MKTKSTEVKWLKDPKDLFETHRNDDLIIQYMPLGQNVLVKKHGKSAKIVSANGYDLSKRSTDLVDKILQLEGDFVLVGRYDISNKALSVHDVDSFNGKIMSQMPFRSRYDLLLTMKDNKVFNILQANKCKNLSVNWDISKNSIGALFKVENLKSDLWYYYPRDQDLRNVVVNSFYLGNRIGNDREVIFKCYQTRRGKQVFVGKMRIPDPKIRKKLMTISQNKKRSVVSVHAIIDSKNKRKYSKLIFDSIVYDKKFKDIVVDDEIYFKPLIIVDIRTQRKSVILTKSVYKNLNMVSGVI